MIAKERPDALFVYPDVVLSAYPRPQQLADFAIKAYDLKVADYLLGQQAAYGN